MKSPATSGDGGTKSVKIIREEKNEERAGGKDTKKGGYQGAWRKEGDCKEEDGKGEKARKGRYIPLA